MKAILESNTNRVVCVTEDYIESGRVITAGNHELWDCYAVDNVPDYVKVREWVYEGGNFIYSPIILIPEVVKMSQYKAALASFNLTSRFEEFINAETDPDKKAAKRDCFDNSGFIQRYSLFAREFQDFIGYSAKQTDELFVHASNN